jgi:hypothetical protein
MADETGTKIIFIRTDEELHRLLKVSAAMSGVTLQGLCESILRTHVQQQTTSGGTVTYTGVTPPVPAQAPAEENRIAAATPGPA